MPSDNEYFDTLTGRSPVLAILRNLSPEKTVDMCRIAWDHGVELVEVPIQAKASLESLKAAIAAARDVGKEIGAGSVISKDQLLEAHRLGITFSVAPGFSQAVSTLSWKLGLPHLPGVATSSDIMAAVENCHTWVKAFPATSLGTDWFEAQHGPFPEVRIVATGGISAANAADYLKAGARAVGVGSSFATPESGALLVQSVSGAVSTKRDPVITRDPAVQQP